MKTTAHTVGDVADAVDGVIELDAVRFRRNVERLHRQGPRVLAELLTEAGASFRMTAVESLVERYAAISEESLAVTGGDTMPPIVKQRAKLSRFRG